VLLAREGKRPEGIPNTGSDERFSIQADAWSFRRMPQVWEIEKVFATAIWCPEADAIRSRNLGDGDASGGWALAAPGWITRGSSWRCGLEMLRGRRSAQLYGAGLHALAAATTAHGVGL
jgi:hypothetical protein